MSVNSISNPINLESAFEELRCNDNAMILAGGTDLMLDIKSGKVNANKLISIMNIKELKKIKKINDHVVIGSTNTFKNISSNTELMRIFGALKDCCDAMGSPQIRNVATIGGNIVNSAAAADSIPTLMVLHASLKFQNEKESRTVKCTDYYKYFHQNKVKKNEILTYIILNNYGGVSGFYKLGKRNSLAISRLSCAVYIEQDKQIVKHFKVALGAVGKVPFRVYDAEKLVEGKSLDNILSDKVVEVLQQAVFNSINGRSTMPFKKEAVAGVYKNAVNKALIRGGLNINE